MGVCTSKNEGKGSANARTINAKSAEAKLPKLLLVGAGGGGKSTLFKQLTIIFGDGFSGFDRLERLPVVHANAINTMKKLMMICLESNIRVNNREAFNYILNLQDHQEVMGNPLTAHLKSLWAEEGVQQAYNAWRYSGELAPHAKHMLDNVEKISKEDYTCSNPDIVLSYARTTGIVELNLKVDDFHCVVYDVGGQRAERKKWMNCFDDVNGLIYVASVGDYDQKTVEDPSMNKLQEDFNLFEGLCDMIPDKPMILVLSKIDLLKEKLADPGARHLSEEITTYRDGNNFENIMKWITSQFLSKNKTEREIPVYTVDLTNEDEVKDTFNAIKDGLSRMKAAGARASTLDLKGKK